MLNEQSFNTHNGLIVRKHTEHTHLVALNQRPTTAVRSHRYIKKLLKSVPNEYTEAFHGLPAPKSSALTLSKSFRWSLTNHLMFFAYEAGWLHYKKFNNLKHSLMTAESLSVIFRLPDKDQSRQHNQRKPEGRFHAIPSF